MLKISTLSIKGERAFSDLIAHTVTFCLLFSFEDCTVGVAWSANGQFEVLLKISSMTTSLLEMSEPVLFARTDRGSLLSVNIYLLQHRNISPTVVARDAE